MCEHCGDDSLSWETWEPIEEPEHGWGLGGRPSCLFGHDLGEGVGEDELPEGCGFPAQYRQLFTEPMEHFCDKHKEAKVAYYEEEYGELPSPMGLDVDRFLEIGDEALCEAFDETTMRDCGKPASWVSVDTYGMEACEHHYRREALGKGPQL